MRKLKILGLIILILGIFMHLAVGMVSNGQPWVPLIYNSPLKSVYEYTFLGIAVIGLILIIIGIRTK